VDQEKDKQVPDNENEPESIVVPSEEEIEEILSSETAPAAENGAEDDSAEVKASFEWPMEEEQARKLFGKAAERDSFLEELKRAKADLINYRNRIKKEREIWSRQALRNVMRSLITTLDNFDLTLKHAEESPEDSAGLLEGLKITHDSLISALESYGLRQLEAAGKPFDPHFHEAMFTEPVPEHTEAMVLEELQTGYMLDEWVLRAPKVKVSEPGPPDQEEELPNGGPAED